MTFGTGLNRGLLSLFVLLTLSAAFGQSDALRIASGVVGGKDAEEMALFETALAEALGVSAGELVTVPTDYDQFIQTPCAGANSSTSYTPPSP